MQLDGRVLREDRDGLLDVLEKQRRSGVSELQKLREDPLRKSDRLGGPMHDDRLAPGGQADPEAALHELAVDVLGTEDANHGLGRVGDRDRDGRDDLALAHRRSKSVPMLR